jgi:alpha-mannosidase
MHGVRFRLNIFHSSSSFTVCLASSLDVEMHHLETARPLKFSKVNLVADGPLRASVQAEVIYGKSTINVTVSQLFSAHYNHILSYLS